MPELDPSTPHKLGPGGPMTGRLGAGNTPLICVAMPTRLRAPLEAEAARRGVKFSEMVRLAAAEFIARLETEHSQEAA
jgi:hypothetical protein